ncbi:MAG: NAD-binding protein [Syntrophobacterales bacterium]|nr:NAD-binding protein [Syntrophobacterales bacterium]
MQAHPDGLRAAERIVKNLLRSVVVDRDREAVERLIADGFKVVEGDATEEETLNLPRGHPGKTTFFR